MRQYLNILFLLTLALGLASCEEDDQYDIESIFIGRTWTGDVGMNAGNGELFSVHLLSAATDSARNTSITSLTELPTNITVSNGIGKMVSTGTLCWITAEPEFLIWMT